MTNETQLTEQLRRFKDLCLVEAASDRVIAQSVATIRSLCDRMRADGWDEQALDAVARRELLGFGMPR